MVEADESQPMNELSPGNMLLQGRLQAGLTQEQVAKELYMTVSKVKALENDEHGRLNSDTFVRGYIRAYATLVKIDVVQVLAAYDKLTDSAKPEGLQQQPTAPAENPARGAWQFLIVIGAFFVALWLISIWFFDNHTETQYVVPVEDVSSAASIKTASRVVSSEASLSTVSSSGAVSSLVSSSTAAPQALIDESQKVKALLADGGGSVGIKSSNASVNNVKEVTNLSSAGVAKSASSVGQMSAVSAPTINNFSESSVARVTEIKAEVNSSSSAKKVGLDEISFSFRGESWLEVSDSRGDVLATELEPLGNKLKLVGRAPFDVKLGNAPAVDIELNGKKIDVIPPLGSNVLILKIGN